MPLTLKVKSTDDVVKRQRETTAQRVIECFRLPDRRLLCFLDDEEWQSIQDEAGVANRGFYRLVTSPDSFWLNAPLYIAERLFVHCQPAFDDFIYLHGSTCSSDVGLTMTLAHELQHAFQHSEQTQLWAANSVVLALSRTTISAMRLTWCDVPIEREARIVSKRIAEQLFGAELVRQHIDGKISEFVTPGDASDWECIRELATSTPYDLARETKLFFPTLKDHRRELERALRECQSESPDFALVNLDALFGGTGERL